MPKLNLKALIYLWAMYGNEEDFIDNLTENFEISDEQYELLQTFPSLDRTLLTEAIRLGKLWQEAEAVYKDGYLDDKDTEENQKAASEFYKARERFDLFRKAAS